MPGKSSRPPHNRSTPSVNPELPLFELDPFMIPSLAEAQIHNYPLSDEEQRWLAYIRQHEELNQEYQGLLAVLKTEQQLPPPPSADLYYILKDPQGKTYRVAPDSARLNLMQEQGAEVIGAEFSDAAVAASSPELNLTELGFALDFTRPSQPVLHSLAFQSIAEAGVLYDPAGVPSATTSWCLHLLTDTQTEVQVAFDSTGRADLPLEPSKVVSWKLLFKPAT